MDYFETLTTPISDDQFCGENLEDDAAFQNFFFTAKGTPERFDGENTIADEPPEWRAIEKQAFVFLEQTKDLKLICIVAQSVLNTKGIVPFSQCLQALSRLIWKQWETVYPLLDEDDGDPLERVAGFSHLNDPFVVNALKNMPLATLKGVGAITLSDIDKAISESDDATFSTSQIKGMFKEINHEELQLLYSALAYSLESLADINSCLIDNSGHEYSVDFNAITEVLTQLKTALEDFSDVQNGGDSETQDVGVNGGEEFGEEYDNDPSDVHKQAIATRATNNMTMGTIQSREDVERTLALINEYYANYEPSSPIPVLVTRALKLVHKDFLAIVKDIYPDALESVHNLAGTNPDDDEDNKDDDW